MRLFVPFLIRTGFSSCVRWIVAVKHLTQINRTFLDL